MCLEVVVDKNAKLRQAFIICSKDVNPSCIEIINLDNFILHSNIHLDCTESTEYLVRQIIEFVFHSYGTELKQFFLGHLQLGQKWNLNKN